MNQYIANLENINNITSFTAYDIENSKNYLLNNNSSDVNSFYLMHTNIRSLAKNYESLELFVNAYKNLYDVIILSETFNITNKENFCLDNYEIYYNSGKINKNDGVIIYVKKLLEHQVNIVGFSDLKFLRLTLTIHNKKIGITGIYRPPSYDVLEFNRHLSDYLKNYCKLENEIISGDMNIDICSKNAISEDYLNIMAENSFVSYINTYTRITNESKSCIDHLFIKTNIRESKFCPVVLYSKISDHFPQLLRLSLHSNESITQHDSKERVIKMINYNQLENYLRTLVNWEETIPCNDANKAAETFITIIEKAVNSCSHQKKVVHYLVKRKSWITTGLMTSLKYRDYLHKKVLKSPQNTLLKNQYITYRNYLNTLIKKTKEQYYKKKINENINNNSKIWATTNEILNRTKNEHNIIKEIRTERGEMLTDAKKIANNLNKYFVNVGTNIAKNINPPDKHNTPQETEKTKNTFVFNFVTSDDIIKYINNLKNDTAPGMDNITSKILKSVKHVISKPLAKIINISLHEGVFPDILKRAAVKPLHKGGDKHEPGNYRPISLISNISKVYENIMKTEIVNFLQTNKLLSDRQFGFRQNLSTQDAIVHLTTKVYNCIDKSKPSLAVFLDLAKAFDTVSHSKLLVKLRLYGFQGKTLNIIKSYLDKRVQYVKNGDAISEPEIIKCGVPQGTVLGPVLFILYINSIFNIDNTCDIVSYADDTALHVEGNSWEEVKITAEKCLKNVKAWLDDNLLKLNYDKTKFLTFSSNVSGQPQYDTLCIHESHCNLQNSCGCSVFIDRVKSTKYLGIIVDCYLRWEEQTYAICSKIRKLFYTFKILRNIFTRTLLKTAYYALVQSVITYGLIAWGGTFYTHLKNVIVSQKILIKIIMKKPARYPTELLFNACGLKDLQDLYVIENLKYLFKKRPLQLLNHGYGTRSITYGGCNTPLMRTTHGQRNFIYFSAKIHNILPQNLKNYSNFTYKQFVWKIKTWVKENKNTINTLFY